MPEHLTPQLRSGIGEHDTRGPANEMPNARLARVEVDHRSALAIAENEIAQAPESSETHALAGGARHVPVSVSVAPRPPQARAKSVPAARIRVDRKANRAARIVCRPSLIPIGAVGSPQGQCLAFIGSSSFGQGLDSFSNEFGSFLN